MKPPSSPECVAQAVQLHPSVHLARPGIVESGAEERYKLMPNELN